MPQIAKSGVTVRQPRFLIKLTDAAAAATLEKGKA
jgi:hypothetical protein